MPVHKIKQGDNHVLAIVKSDKLRQQLLTIFDGVPEITSKVIVGDSEMAEKHIHANKPNGIVMFEISKKDQNVVESVRVFKEACGGKDIPFIIISDKLEDKKMVGLLRLGVSDFLTLPLSEEETKESIERVSAKYISESKADSPIDSKIITFAHASGGMGSTTLAVNAATLINETSTKNNKVACLLDLDLQFGGASIHLDLPGYSPVIDLLNKPERLDNEMLEGMMMRHSSGLRILTTPEIPLPVESINGDIIDKLLQIAQSRYPYIVVDMPQTMTLWTDAVFRKSCVIYVIMQMNIPSIRQLRRWFSVLEQEGLQNLPIKVVCNRHSSFGRIRHDNISIAQASEALGRKIDFMIPNDYDLILQSLDQGMPAAKIRPNSKFVRQLQAMLSETVDEIELPKKSFLMKKQ